MSRRAARLAALAGLALAAACGGTGGPGRWAGGADTLQVWARVRGERFETLAGGAWQPFYVKGVNLSTARPGRFPGEFPVDEATYARWLPQMAAMGANTLRVYTILPPAFYAALLAWNEAHPDRPLWLLQGAWTELPPDDDFADPAWLGDLRGELRRAVDVVHGATSLPARPGHASGRYRANVSRWTLGYLLGREWEPFAVAGWNARHAGQRAYTGRFFRTPPAPAMERWLAELCDSVAAHEHDTYRTLRPVAFTNWPTLDPLVHPTEATRAEEWAMQHPGGPPAPPLRALDDDAVAVDANLVEPSPANVAGTFVSYHVYPYHPDFLLYDPGYLEASSPWGRSPYFGYLAALHTHHAGRALLVAEYGVPSSRGIARQHPLGWHHGGHDETAMAALDARLTREIRASGSAGGVVFEWIDEWFKTNWMVADLEQPAEHRPRWLNVQNPEEHYGLLGERPRLEGIVVPGGDPGAWRVLPTLDHGPAEAGALAAAAVHAAADEGYVYLAVPFPGLAGRPFPWDTAGLLLALDTVDPERGQRRLPVGLPGDVGFEFLVRLDGADSAALLATPDYNPYSPQFEAGDLYRRPIRPVPRDDGRFDPLLVITNRVRLARDGRVIPARGTDRGRLRAATAGASIAADWAFDAAAGLLEVRLPWGLLNVTDPSTLTVVDDSGTGWPPRTRRTEGLRIGVATWRKGVAPAVVAALPRREAGRWRRGAFPVWRWDPWTEPGAVERRKPAYDSLRAAWGEAP